MTKSKALKINIVVGGRFHAGQLYEALVSLGHDVHIYASSPARYFKSVPKKFVTFIPKPAQLLQKGLKVRIPRWIHEYSALTFDAVVSRIMRPADIVWGFNGDSYLAGKQIKKQGGVYILDRACPHFVEQEELLKQESESTGYPYALQTTRTRQRFLGEYELADLIVVPSNYSASSFPKRGTPASRVVIAPLDANAPRPSERDAERIVFPGVKPGDIVVGLVGGSFLRKGILYLLRAIESLGRQDIKVVIRATERNVRQHPEACVLCDRLGVVFVPYLDDINSFYRSLDIFVLPSVDEGFGMVVYEALRNGVPVVASTHVGATDGMLPGKDFVLVPAQDSLAIADAVEQLAADSALRRRIGENGRAFHRTRMSAGGQYRQAVAAILSRYLGE